MQSRKTLVSATFVLILVGVIGLVHLMQQPRFQSFHNVDVLQLIASGMCFGVALSGLLSLMGRAKAS